MISERENRALVNFPNENSLNEINRYVIYNVAGENDYIICAKCSSIKPVSGDGVFENDRNTQPFKLEQYDKA